MRIVTFGAWLTTIVFLATLSTIPFLDLPNHLARWHVLSSLMYEPDSPFIGKYSYEFHLQPYILLDLLAAPALQRVPPVVFAQLLVGITFILSSISPVVFARARGARGEALTIFFGLSQLLALNWFFLSGFIAFQLGTALMFLLLALLYARSPWPLALRAPLFLVGSATIYLLHFGAFVSICLATAGFSLVETVRAKRLSPLWPVLTCAAICIWHVFSGLNPPTDVHQFVYGSAFEKIKGLAIPFVRASTTLDVLTCFLWIVVCTISIVRRRFDLREDPGLLLATLVVGVMYITLPRYDGRVYDMDNRMVPTFVAFGALLAFGTTEAMSRTQQLLVIAAVLLNVGVTLPALRQLDEELAAVQNDLNALPYECTLLPVATLPDLGRLSSALHFGSLATVLRDCESPYLFRNSPSSTLFHFRWDRERETPDLFWYLRPADTIQPHWEKTLPNYEFVAATKPLDLQRFPPELSNVAQDARSLVIFAPGKGNALHFPSATE